MGVPGAGVVSGPAPVGRYFHVAILVADLDAAMVRFGEVLGLTFTDPLIIPADSIAGSAGAVAVRWVYAHEGPPYLELIEGRGDGVFSLANGEGVHHLGFWDPDAPQRCSLLADAGLATEAQLLDPAGGLVAFFTRPEDLHGVRLEILSDLIRPAAEQWIAGPPRNREDSAR